MTIITSSAAATDPSSAAAVVPGTVAPTPPVPASAAARAAPVPGTLTINPADAAEQVAALDWADTAARRAGHEWHGPEWHRTPPEAAAQLIRGPSWRWARANTTTSQEGTDDG